MIAEVVVDISNDNVDRVYDYIALPETKAGVRVKVPFANRLVLGYVLKLKETSSVDEKKLKSVKLNLDTEPIIKTELLEMTDWLANRFFLRKADVFKLLIPSIIRNDLVKEKVEEYVSLAIDLDSAIMQIGNRAKAQLATVGFLSNNGEVKRTELSNMFGSQIVKTLLDKGIIGVRSQRVFRTVKTISSNEKRVTLNDEQKIALEQMAGKNNVFLLKGVTGSGKTEVYMNVIEKALQENKTAIMLVPEISLTPQMVNRFSSRFPDIVAVLHSGLSDGEKYDEWKRIFDGEAKVIVGARSAIFAPIENLGAIIIDEEHDGSYLSETNPRYNTEDVARFRASYNKCPLILGSATPKIESYQKALEGEFKLIELNKRVNNLEMPNIQIVDMLTEIMDGNTSPYSRLLLSKIQEAINNKKQAILFINRRGYASFMMCKECGYIAKCDDCAVSLVYHKDDSELKCHFCGKRYRALTNCPECNSKNIKYGALGTEKVCNDLKELFNNVPIFRMDNDTTRTKDSYQKILSGFASSTPSILVGTQMIAKGHDYPNVAFVGILDADVSLYTSDYRSAEKTFQLVTQVAGRTGRKNNDGFVVLQTYAPKHYVYRYATNYDYVGFFEKEINLRQTTQFPPYTTIVRILVSGEDEKKVLATTKQIYDTTLQIKEKYGKMVAFLQAMASPVKRIQKKYRYQILARVKNYENLIAEFYKASDVIAKDVSIFVELNPNNLR